MSLYNKYRPNKFSEVFGNRTTIQSIETLLSKKEIPHAFLLTGGYGCGKTTVGRIIAETIGAVGSDFREINSADFRGIDTVRDLIKQCQYKALEGDYRAWLIDECHKWTNDAQNAMLKLLEDPPPHVYFILATTEPEKLLSTIKSRCSTFSMNPLNDQEMGRLLKKIVIQEKETLEKEVYDQIIQDSLGHPRNAIQILEQVLSVENEKRLEIAKRKAEEYSESIELCRVLINEGSWKKVAGILSGLKAANQEPETVRRIVLGYCQSILLKGEENDRAGLILEEFKNNFYDSGFPQLVYACYSVCRG